jgi:translation initiation factor 4G
MRMPASPYQATRSPAMQPAHLQPGQMPQQNGPHMPHPYGGYPPQHMNPQQQVLSLASSLVEFEELLTFAKNPGMYIPQGYESQYAAYYGQPMYPPPQHLQFPGAPPSPRPFPGQYYPNQHGQNPQSLGMSRSSSQGIERPNSTLGQPSTPAPHTPHPPAATSSSPAPTTSTFTRPTARKSAAIVIKNADGEVLDFKKTAPVASPPPVKPSGGPVVVSSSSGVPSTSTPPPRTHVASPQQHARSESQQAKTAEERKREFQEAIQKQAKGDEAEEKKVSDAAKEKDEDERKSAEAEVAKAAQDKEAAEKAKQETEAAEKAKEDEEEEKRRKDEEMEAWIAKLEEDEREEEEREKAYQAKKKAEAEAKAKQEAEMADEEMRRQEREAEALEEAKLKGKQDGESDAEAKALFAQLGKNTQFGPAATESASGASTPASEPVSAPSPAVQAVQPVKPAPFGKPKPAALKLETNKPIEPAQPTAGMQSLKSARFLQVRSESVKYPEGILSPNPAINQGGKKAGQRYDKTFLLQFQDVFKEKPSIDWDKVVKETVGDASDSARPASARTPSAAGGRQASRGPGGMPGALGGAMGSFASRPLAPGTTSEQRFQASLQGSARPAPSSFPSFGGGRPGAPGFPMGAPGMIRSSSSQSIAQGGMNSPRNASQRGQGGRNSRRGPNHQQEAQMAKTMPLTAGLELKPLVVSKTGWVPASIVAPQQVQVMPGTHMAPDMVQRKVKAALNKMTPEKFDKIANDILAIASQSKDENDGRTLRQVIQLTFEKACDEAHWASMYAKFCKRMLEEMGPEIKDENVRDKQDRVVVGGALFRKYLLNRCQEEFERGWEVDLPEKPEGQTEEVMLSDEYYIAAAAKRRGLGLIQFIGELYKLGMLTLRIMHECVVKLLQFEGLPDEAAVESLTKLLRTIGATMDADPKGEPLIDTYFDRISTVKSMQGLPSRLFYMLEDIIDLRKKKWKSKDDAKGPKTIQEIREDAIHASQVADMERQRSSQRGGRPPAGRGDARSFSHNMPPPDYPRNQVGMDDLKKLTRNARTTTTGPSALGPTSLLGSRSSSGRRGLQMTRGGEDSGASSRTGTPPVKEKESATHQNAFRYVFQSEI